MPKHQHLTTPPDTAELPKGIPYIIGNEAAERFSFYGMKAVLAVFMTKFLLDMHDQPAYMSDEDAKIWIHNFGTAVYFFPILGAFISDWLTGKYRMILALSVVYCAGHAVLALIDLPVAVEPRQLLFWGLALIAIGAGGIKPCVSAHVGDQFGKGNQHRLSRMFSWFYFSINLGAMVSTLLTPILLDELGPAWAFGVPGVLMALATVAFWMGRKVFVHIPPAGNRFFKETFSWEGIRAVGNLVPLYTFIAVFWALFDQTASAWVLQAEDMNRHIFGWEIRSSQIQAANPFLVMFFIPVFSYGIYPFLSRFFQLTPLRKIGIGLFVTVPAFAIPAWIEMGITRGESPHIIWQFLAYVVLTAAEILVSVTALEFSYTQAPKKMKSFIMGLYLLSVAVGNQLTVQVNVFIKAQKEEGVNYLAGANYYWFFTGLMAVTAVVYVAFAQFYRGQTYIQGAEKQHDSADAKTD
jgi:POT family proton-dependent oligopeptide transporter